MSKFKGIGLFQSLKQQIPHTKFGINQSIVKFNEETKDIIDEKFRIVILNGQFNPFVKESIFPVTKLNINYLLDPRNIPNDLEYNSLYDEHKEGITINRADPLNLKNVAKTPFFPNELPQAKGIKPWWEIAIDFFKGDL